MFLHQVKWLLPGFSRLRCGTFRRASEHVQHSLCENGAREDTQTKYAPLSHVSGMLAELPAETTIVSHSYEAHDAEDVLNTK